jgi:predicted ATPase
LGRSPASRSFGKSRIAHEVALRTTKVWPDEPRCCDLGGLHYGAAICERIARQLERPLQRDAAATVGSALADLGRSLVVLDNLDDASIAPLIARWLDKAPLLRVIVTARERLRIPPEIVVEVAPLPEAEELFIDRAARLMGNYQPSPAERATVTAIVDRLDRIPLAVELAAAQMTALSPAEILTRLQTGLDVLGRARRDANARQATMCAAIDWSWRFLSAEEQLAFARCSVFHGGFTIAALQGVIGEDLAASAVELLQSLRDKSLLFALPSEPGLPYRFGLYESIRRFAREHLDRTEAGALQLRHARHYLDWG